MAEVANISAGPVGNLLREIGVSGTAQGVSIEVRDEGDICILDRAFAVAEPDVRYRLSGLCRWRAVGLKVEVEMVSHPDKRRDVLYLDDGQDLHVFTPPGTYGFRYRFLSPPGTRAAAVSVTREGLGRRLGLYAVKAWGLARRGPAALLAAARLLARPRQGVVATRIAPKAVAGEADLPARPPLTPPQSGILPTVSIIIPTRDRHDLLAPCIASLYALEGVDWDVIIVDNGSIDPETVAYLAGLAADPRITVVRQDIPFNFSRLCNVGATGAKGQALLFLNDDIEALDGTWLAAMLTWLADPTVGVVGPRLLYPSRHLQHAGIATHLVPGPGHPWRGVAPKVWRGHPIAAFAGEVDAVTGACLLLRTTDFVAAGGFDEGDFAITLNDVDLCLKLRRRGMKSLYTPEATLIHKEGQSRANDHSAAERDRRRRELKAFFELYPDFARQSCFYPQILRRDSDQGLPF